MQAHRANDWPHLKERDDFRLRWRAGAAQLAAHTDTRSFIVVMPDGASGDDAYESDYISNRFFSFLFFSSSLSSYETQ